MTTDLLLLGVGLVLLFVGGELLVRGAVGAASRMGISALVVGITVVSFGTSAPELLVSVKAAVSGSPAIALGNVAGSNIANLALILGLTVLIFPLPVARDTLRIHWPVMMIATLLLPLLLRDGELSRVEGSVCLGLLIFYIIWMVVRSRQRMGVAGTPMTTKLKPWAATMLLVTGGVLLALGAEWAVEGSVNIARGLGVSEQLIGLTVIAFGTSLPELAASIMAAFKKQPDISVGNLIGSNIYNLLGILGATAAVEPIGIDFAAFHTDLIVMVLISLVLLPMMGLRSRLLRVHGAFLFGIYAAYMVFVIIRG